MSGCHGYRPPFPGLAKCLLWSFGLGAGFSVSLLLSSRSDPSALNFKRAYFVTPVRRLRVLGYLGSLWCPSPLTDPFPEEQGRSEWNKNQLQGYLGMQPHVCKLGRGVGCLGGPVGSWFSVRGLRGSVQVVPPVEKL